MIRRKTDDSMEEVAVREGEKLGRLLRLASHRFEAEKRATVAGLGVTTSQLDVLGYLAERGGAATQADLVTYLQASRATVSGLVTRLEHVGLVMRTNEESPGRTVAVRLTESAWPIVETSHQRLEGMDERLTAGFTDDERLTLVRLLRELASIGDSA